MTKSYTFNGHVEDDLESWVKWINDANELFELFGFNPNYYAINTDENKASRIGKIGGISRKIKNIEKKNSKIITMSFQLLPKEFNQAIFDYIISSCRGDDFVTFVINQDYINKEYDEKQLISILRRNIEATVGEIYLMKIEDCPEIYAAKSKYFSFPSLRVISKLL